MGPAISADVSEVSSLRLENEALRSENARLLDLLAQPTAVRLEYARTAAGAETHVELQHWALLALVESFAKSLGDAPNYITGTVAHPEVGAFEVTLRRAAGRAPAEDLAELRAEVARLRAAQGMSASS